MPDGCRLRPDGGKERCKGKQAEDGNEGEEAEEQCHRDGCAHVGIEPGAVVVKTCATGSTVAAVPCSRWLPAALAAVSPATKGIALSIALVQDTTADDIGRWFKRGTGKAGTNQPAEGRDGGRACFASLSLRINIDAIGEEDAEVGEQSREEDKMGGKDVDQGVEPEIVCQKLVLVCRRCV